MFTTLPGPAEVEQAAFGEDGLHAGAAGTTRLVHVVVSTVGPACVRKLAEHGERDGVELLDAPLSAGPIEDGELQLTLWVGGRPTTYARLRPVLGAIAKCVLYCGPAGNAQVVKLVNNVTTLAFARVLGETLSLGVRAGVPLETLRAALAWGTAQNRLSDEHFGNSVFAGNWRPGYRVDLAKKDVLLARELAAEAGAPLGLADDLLEATAELERRGWSDRSIHSLVRLAEEAADVELRLQPFAGRELLPEEGGEEG